MTRKRSSLHALLFVTCAALTACGDGGKPSPPEPKPTAAVEVKPTSTAEAKSAPTSPAPAATSTGEATAAAEETLTSILSDAAPILGELEDDEDAQIVLRAGELLKIVREVRRIRWVARMEGVPSTREGMAFEVYLSPGGGLMYAFQPDLGPEVTVPTTRALCDAIAAKGKFELGRCPDILRRARTSDGGIVAYVPCNTAACPVALRREGKLEVIAVDGISHARFRAGKQRSSLLVQSRWAKDEGKQSGGHIVPILFEGDRLTAAAPITTDRVDARDLSKVTNRFVQIRISDTEIALTGEEIVSAADGTVTSKTKIDEKHPLPPLD